MIAPKAAKPKRIPKQDFEVGDQVVVLDGDVVWTIRGFFGKDAHIADLKRPGWTAATSAYRRDLRLVRAAADR